MKYILSLLLGAVLGYFSADYITLASDSPDEASLGDCVIIIEPRNGGPRLTLGWDVTDPNEVEEAVVNIEPQEGLQITNMDVKQCHESVALVCQLYAVSPFRVAFQELFFVEVCIDRIDA